MASTQTSQVSSSAQGDDEEVCTATPEDKMAVLEIDPDFHGLDYLADTYTTLTKGPGAKSYVLKKKDKIVGFFSGQLVDGGQTLVTSAGRVMKDYRGGGLYGRAKKKVFESFRGSGLLHIAMVLNNVNMKSFGEKLLKTYRLVCSRECCAYRVDMDAIQKKDLTKLTADTEGVHQISSEEDLSLLLTLAGDRLFPDGRIMVELKPYRVTMENVPGILHGGSHERVFIVSGPDANFSPKNHQLLASQDLLFSCGSYYYNQTGVSYVMDMYASNTCESSDQVQKHLKWHFLRLINAIQPQKAFFHVLYSRQVSNELEALSQEFPNKNAGFPFSNMNVFEMDYKQ